MAHVLVVDDHPSILSAMKSLLTGDGHTVECAETGAEALGLLRLRHFDVVVTDLEIPPPDGADVARAVRAAGTATCVYICTAASKLDRALAAEPCFLFSKPLDYDSLHEHFVACRSCDECRQRDRCHGRLHQ